MCGKSRCSYSKCVYGIPAMPVSEISTLLQLTRMCRAELLKAAITIKDQHLDHTAVTAGGTTLRTAGGSAAHDALYSLIHRRGGSNPLGLLHRTGIGGGLITVERDCTLDRIVATRVTLCRRGGIVTHGGITTLQQHLAVTEHEPHDVQAWIGTMDLADDLITHFLVATIQQLRKCGTRNLTGVGKLGTAWSINFFNRDTISILEQFFRLAQSCEKVIFANGKFSEPKLRS